MGMRNTTISLTKGAVSLHTEYTTSTPKTQGEPLHDVSPTGRVRPWRLHRLEAEQLAEAYQTIAARTPEGPEAVRWQLMADRASSCATNPKFEVHRAPRADGGGEYLTLSTAYFCRDRLCPMCQWRRSLKLGAQARAVVAECNRDKISRDRVPYRWIMVTLTQRNVDGPDLPAELDKMHDAMHRLVKRKEWRAAAQGWLRVTEITHNIDRRSKAYDTYHPHMHVMIAVNARYFKSKDYITHAQWVALWRDCMGLDYDPSVQVETIKPNDGQQLGDNATAKDVAISMGKAVAEVTKYASKPSSYLVPYDLDLTASAVQTLSVSLKGRRLAAWGGVCKKAAQALKLDSLETGDLIHIDEEPSADLDAEAVNRYITYYWALGVRNYLPEREEVAPASWAAAAEGYKQRRAAAAGRRANDARLDASDAAKIAQVRAAFGDKIARRVIHNKDGHAIKMAEQINAAKEAAADDR